MLAVVVMVFVALARDWGPPDVLLMGATFLAGLVGIIKPGEVVMGFANENMLTVAALYIVAAALRETGGLDILGRRVFGVATSEGSALFRMAIVLTVASAFLNNTPIVAMFLPIITGWCRKNRVSPSRLLIPLSFMTILGGVCTMIGTSTNLVVNGLMAEWSRAHKEFEVTLRPMSLFELGKVGLPMAVVGCAFMLTLGRRLLPDRKDLIEQIGESSREYLADMLIQPHCRLVGKKVEEAGLRHLPGLFLMEINREDRMISPVEPDDVLRAGDRLTFTGVVNTIMDLERIPGLVPAMEDEISAKASERRNRRLCEAVVSSSSPLLDKSIREANFRARYNAAVMAVHRGGSRIRGRIGDIVLRPGDTLLLQTGPHFAQAHYNNPAFYLVSSVAEARPVRHDKAWLALALLLGLIGLLACGIIKEVMSAFLIAGLMVVTRCISSSVARQSLDMPTLISIAASFGLGRAIEISGVANAIGSGISQLTLAWGPTIGPIAALSAIYLVTMFSSELLTNNASAALMFPFAVATAQACGADPRSFAMAVALASSAAFATPIGYQTHMMVWGPGGYRFTDFIRVGVPLDMVCWIVATILLPIAWPFH